ncbi:hypothetical protein ACWD26_11265 [Streptomyces sp. NPDC002787]
MTSRLRSTRSPTAPSHIATRLAHAMFGVLAAAGWLLVGGQVVEPAVVGQSEAPAVGRQRLGPVGGRQLAGPADRGVPVVPVVGGQPAVRADSTAPGDDEASGVDLILPVAAAGAAAAVAAYSLVRRRRRIQLRTTPTGTYEPPVAPLPDLRRRAERLLVDTDDSVRTSAEELRFAAARAGRRTEEPHAERPTGGAETGRHAERPTAPEATEPRTTSPASDEANGRPAETSAAHDRHPTEPRAEKPAGPHDAETPAQGPADDGDAEPSGESPASEEDAGRHAEKPAVPDEAEPHADNPPAPDASEPPADEPVAPDAHVEKRGTRHPTGPHAENPAADDPAEPPVEKSAGGAGARPVALDPGKPYAETPAARDAVMPFVEALEDARGELVGAFRAGLRLDEGAGVLSPDEERALLEEILTRCTTAQRRLDTATPAFDQLRALERDISPALECAETRFRELTGRTATAATTLTALRDGYAPAASLPVTGHVEQAKDRLVFATTELNRARQAAYPGDLHTAAVHLRAAEGAIDQADVFVTGVERLAAELAEAATTAQQDDPLTGPYDDPLDVLRRQGRPLLPARSAVAAASDFITTHRGAVGVAARTRLSEAERHLAQTGTDTTGTGADSGSAAPGNAPAAQRAHALAEEARRLAEQDVRAYGNPYGGLVGDGLAGALLGGIILREPPDATGREGLRGPACYGGTATRGRRTAAHAF